MGFWVSLVVSLVLTVVGELLRPKQKFKDPKPSALGEFQFPTADSTRVISVWWGTCACKGPNVTWFGDLATVAIKKKVKTGWFSSTTITQGFKYYLGVQLVYGYGFLDELIDFRIDDKSVFGSTPNSTTFGGFDGNVTGWLSSASESGGTVSTEHGSISAVGDYYSFNMDAPELLGSDDPPEGVSGPVKIYRGTDTQPANDYLTAQWGEVEGSGFRPLIYAVLEHCYLGNSDTPPPITLIGRRTPNPLGLTSGRHNIKGDANPANMCYEVMTNKIFGMKIPEFRIDKDDFIAVGNVLAEEGFGLSMQLDTAMTAKDLLAEILRHVDGVIYPDPVTGLYTIKLARDDYDVNTIPVYTAADIDPESFEFSRISWDATKNTTVVNYIDRSLNFQNTPVGYQDLANVFVRRGQIDSETIDFLGFSRAEQAMRVAARANKTRSSPLCRLAFATNRRGYTLRPSSVIKVVLPQFGINGLIVRVVDLNYGTLDHPAINVITTEDIYSLNALAYSPPADTTWTPPGATPLPLAAQRLEEAPYFGAPATRQFIMTLASRAGAFELGYQVWSDPTGGTDYARTNTTPDFTPSALLTAAYLASGPDQDEDGFTVSSGIDMDAISGGSDEDREDGRNLVLVGNEFMAWRNIVDNGDGTHTVLGVWRGVLDTLPQDHSSGDRVWFFSEGAGLTDTDGYGNNPTVKAKLLTYTSKKVLPIASATAMTLTTNTRSARPLPPGKVRVNGARIADITGDTVLGIFGVTWASRNRTSGLIVPQDADSVDPEESTVYNIRFYRHDTHALIAELNGIHNTSVSVQLAYTGLIDMELESVRYTRKSWQIQTGTFDFDANGATTNVITEGAAPPGVIIDGGEVVVPPSEPPPPPPDGGGGTPSGDPLLTRTRGTTVLNVLDYGAIGNGVHNDTANIQAAFDDLPGDGGTVQFPTGYTFMVDSTTSILLPSYCYVEIQPGAEVKGMTNTAPSDFIFRLNNKTHVEIGGGGRITGDRGTFVEQLGTTSEGGHAIKISGGSHYTVRDLTISDCVGDAISADRGPYPSLTDVRYDNLRVSNVRRNGLSIGGSTYVYVTNCNIGPVIGTSPQAGIDVEINNVEDGHEARHIYINNTHIHDCRGPAINCWNAANEVNIEDNILEYCVRGVLLKNNESANITGNIIRHNRSMGVTLKEVVINANIDDNIFFNNDTGAVGIVPGDGTNPGDTTAHSGLGGTTFSKHHIGTGVYTGSGLTTGTNNYGP